MQYFKLNLVILVAFSSSLWSMDKPGVSGIFEKSMIVIEPEEAVYPKGHIPSYA